MKQSIHLSCNIVFAGRKMDSIDEKMYLLKNCFKLNYVLKKEPSLTQPKIFVYLR